MPQSLANVLVHLVFSTKDRHPFLIEPHERVAMHRFLGAVSNELACPVISVGGTEDHIHCFARQGRMIALADWVKEIKRVSSQWAKAQSPNLREFQWQAGYGAFSVSQSLSADVHAYIQRQEQHHRKIDFQTELRTLFDAHEVAYDERFIWD